MIKKLLTLCLVATLTITSFTSCSKSNDTETTIEIGVNGYIYTPEYVELPKGDDNSSIRDVDIQNNNLYYSIFTYNAETEERNNTYYKKSLEGNAEAEELAFSLEQNNYISNMVVSESNELYLVINKYNEVANSSSLYIEKYDAEGNQIFSIDISNAFNSEHGLYIREFAVDSKGRMVVATDDKILLFDAGGQSKGEIPTISWINTLCVDKEDNFYTIQNGQEGMELAQIDFEGKAFTNTFKNIPYSQNIVAGENNDFIVTTDSSVYTYSLETQTLDKLCDWVDSDINSQNIQGFNVLDDGRFAVYMENWNGEFSNTELVLLTKTKVADMEPKEIIVVGTLYQDQNLQREAVEFNKSSEKYRIKIKTYIEDNFQGGEKLYEDALTRMNNDMVLSGGLDIINISYDMNLQNLAEKGVLADLSSFLDKSDALKKDDFIDNIINEFTYNDTLATIPSRIQIRAALAKTALSEAFGNGNGWSISELIAYSKENPETKVFDYTYNFEVLNNLLLYNQDGFINYQEGKCNLDSDEFKAILEFSNEFPSPETTGSSMTVISSSDFEGKSTPYKLQDNELLINEIWVDSVGQFQMYKAMFDEPSMNVGYPTIDGSYLGGTLSIAGSTYAISSKSKNQEGAWDFIESVLVSDAGSDRGHYYGLPTRKALLEQVFEDAMKPDYILDENGEPMLDEDGTPIINTSTHHYNDWKYEVVMATQEEVDELRGMIEEAQLAPTMDNEVRSIIMEEVESYFQGQKSAEDVMTVVQSRVQLYVSENN